MRREREIKEGKSGKDFVKVNEKHVAEQGSNQVRRLRLENQIVSKAIKIQENKERRSDLA